MKVREVIKRLEADGWYHDRTKGSHRQFKHPNKSGTVTVLGAWMWTTSWYAKKYMETSSIRRLLMHYLVVIEQGETSYGAYIPDLPGCVAVGETVEEVKALIAEAIEFHIEGMLEDGETIPKPTSIAHEVEVLVKTA